ncbi:MAG: hypothetical protein ACC645_24015, partial [Pirellulales bacterium]
APDDLVWRDGMSDWEPAESLGWFGDRSPPPAPPPVATRPGADRPAHRAIADPPKKRRTVDRNLASRRHRSPGNASKIIWSCVGAVAVLLCGVWIGYAFRPPADLTSQLEIAAVETKAERPPASPRSEPPTPSSAEPAEEPGGTEGLISEPEQDPTPPIAADFAPGRAAVSEGEPNTGTGTTEPPVEPSGGATEPLLSAAPPRGDSPPRSNPAPRADPSQQSDAPATFYQEIDIQRKPTFTVQGMTIAQQVHYRILSKFDVGPRQADGTRKAVQIVEDTRLDQADELSRATFAKSLEALKRQQFTYTLNRRNEVIEFKGHSKNIASLPVDLLAGKGFMVTSVIDEDGWKELAQVTFFLPDDGVRQGQPYTRQMTHDWDPLGRWTGVTTFVGKGRTGPFEQIDYAHELAYEPPAKKAGVLPFQITGATFTPDVAAGTILFDPDKRRVSQVQERFQVTGTVATEVLGQPATIQLQEQQILTLRVSDQRPDRTR